MNPQLIILFIAIPMTTGVLSLLLPGRPAVQRAIGVGGLLINAAFALAVLIATLGDGGRIFVSQMADWPAPFGISVVVDPLAALMLAITAVVLLASYVYCLEQVRGHFVGSLFHPLFHLLGVGVQWSFIAGDLFNLFVAFEIMLMASYVLIATGGSKAQLQQAYKYVLLNLLASFLLVTSCGLIYGHLGTLNFADLARLSHSGAIPREAIPAIVLLLFVFGAKTAIFPLWFWLPDTYHTLPAGLGGLFGGLLTKVGAYVMIRTFVMVFGPAEALVAETVRPLLLISAGVTMFVGVLGAVSMGSIRRILSIHIISQVGYMVLAVGLAIATGLTTHGRELIAAGGIFFILHNMVVKSALFLCGGVMRRHAGTDVLDQMGGLARRTPWLAALFMVAALSLAGLPPLSGFFGKYVLIREAFRGEHYFLAVVALATSTLTLLSMLKIWNAGFWSPAQGTFTADPAARPHVRWAMAAITLLVCTSLSMGLFAERWFDASRIAARLVVDPHAYIEAVLGPQPASAEAVALSSSPAKGSPP